MFQPETIAQANRLLAEARGEFVAASQMEAKAQQMTDLAEKARSRGFEAKRQAIAMLLADHQLGTPTQTTA